MATAAARQPSSVSISRPVNLPPVAVAGALVVLGTQLIAQAVSWTQGALFLVGVLAGVTLYRAAFGLTV